MSFLKPKIRFALSLVVVLATLFWFASRIELGDVVVVLRESSARSLLIFFGFSLLMSLLRSWRYKILFAANGLQTQTWRLFLIVLVRNFCSDLLPARLGSLIFIPLALKTVGARFSSASASFGAALFLDIVAMIPILLIALLLVITGLEFDLRWIVTVIVLLVVLTSISGLLIFPALRFAKYITGHSKFLNSAYSEKLIVFIEQVTVDVQQYLRSGILFSILILSILSRMAKYCALIFLLQAMLPPLGLSLTIESIPGALVGLIAAELSASLPISGIAGFGMYQGAWALVFRMVGFDPAVADITAISHSIFAQAYGLLMGLSGLILLFLSAHLIPRKVTTASSSLDFRKLIVFAGSLFITLLFIGVRVTKSDVAVAEVGTAYSFTPAIADGSKSPPPATILPGLLVYDSRTSGRFEIHFYDFVTATSSVLVRDEQHLQFPSVSPDGRLLAVARTPSLSRLAPATVLVIDLESKQIVHSIPQATFPSFFEDGRKILFERSRSEIWEYDIAKKKEKRVFPTRQDVDSKFKNRQIVKPRPGSNASEIAFISDYPARWTSWIINLAEPEQRISVPDSCQPIASSGGALLVSLAGGYTRVVRPPDSDASKATPNVLQPFAVNEHSQYFPTPGPEAWVFYSVAPKSESAHEDGRYDLYMEKITNGERWRIPPSGKTNRWGSYVAAADVIRRAGTINLPELL
jgi:uncharacterized membrane protein YbhN (UPF0104 family)